MLNHNSNICSVPARMYTIVTYIHKYVYQHHIRETAPYTYVRTWYTHGVHRGENDTMLTSTVVFYCILKQPSEPTASYTCNRKNNTSYDVFMNGKTHYSI